MSAIVLNPARTTCPSIYDGPSAANGAKCLLEKGHSGNHESYGIASFNGYFVTRPRWYWKNEPHVVGSYADELTRAMDYLAQDERTLFIGQAVAVKGHALTATYKNVPRAKLLEFPVAEELQMGYSIGLALQGFIPVTMFPRFNFLLCALNQLVNHLDKLSQMSGGGYQPKVIIRTCIGSVKPLDPGPQHQGDLTEAFRLLCPNVDVIRLDAAEQIFPAYEKALTREDGKSTLIAEWGDLYLD